MSSPTARRTRVLIVDDSASVRQMMTDIPFPGPRD
jgi:hypothetical protein